jgi:tyrosinase
MTVNLGPFSFALTFGTSIPPNAFDYNPRCLSRSLNDWVTTNYLNWTDIDDLLNAPTIIDFQTLLSGIPPSLATLGIHGAAHNCVGESLADFFASPQDPAFMLLHGQIDRLWTTWQAADETSRRYAINGSSSIYYATTTPEATLNTMLDWNVLGESRTMLEVMSPLAYDYCYKYT